MTDLKVYNLHLPDLVCIFTVPERYVLRWDEEVFVYEVPIDENLALRHYSFYRRWFEVNCSLDRHGRFATEPGPIDWCFNIDLCTPYISAGSDGYNVDLCLDLLVGDDGKSHHIKDEDEFEEAQTRGWIAPEEAEEARRGLEELLSLVESETLIDFLTDLHPFTPCRIGPLPPPMQTRSLSELPAFPYRSGGVEKGIRS